MTSLRHYIDGILHAAERGYGPDEQDLARIPAAILEEVQTVTNRLVALAAAGEQLTARTEQRRAIDQITSASLAAGISPTAEMPRSATQRQAVLDALSASRSETKAMIEGIPR